LLALSSGAPAMSLRELRALEATQEHGAVMREFYLVGALEGLLDGQAQSLRSGGRAQWCPNGRSINPEKAPDFFAAELARHPDDYEADMPVTLVLQQSLASIFPCETP
jgi:hypothetical protein